MISFISRLDPNVIRQEELIKKKEARIQALQTDRVRGEDLTNLLLAIQEFITEKGVIPESLEALREDGYLNSNHRTKDPETGKPYYFQKIENDFVLCAAMSDQIKGVNTSECQI